MADNKQHKYKGMGLVALCRLKMCFPKSFHFAAFLLVGQSSYLMTPSLCDCMTSQIHLLYTEGGEVHHWLELETRTLREPAGIESCFCAEFSCYSLAYANTLRSSNSTGGAGM